MPRATLALLALIHAAGCEFVASPSREQEPALFTLAGDAQGCEEGDIVYAMDAIYRVRADGSEEPVQLTFVDEVETSPRWSPDGRRIAFLRADELWIMDRNGANPTMALASSPFVGTFSRLAWSPDGGCIAIALDRGPDAIVLYDVASETARRVGSGDGADGIAWLDSDALLYAINDAAGNETQLRRMSRVDPSDDSEMFAVGGSVSGIAYSPSGQYVAVARAELGRTEVYDESGTSLGFVGDASQGGEDPFWSPDLGCIGMTRGSSIVIHGLAGGGEAVFGGWTGDWSRSVDDAPPVASFTAMPETATVGESVTFDPRASTDDQGIVEYVWDFDGDGVLNLVETVAQVTRFAYGAPGVYEARLTVRDAAGNKDTTTRTVTVGAGMVTLTIDFKPGASSSVVVNVDGTDVSTCTATCEVRTAVGAFVTLTAGGNFYGWIGWDDELAAATCVLTMNADRTVTLLPPS